METWQLIVSVCAGIITVLSLFEKMGLTAAVRKVDYEFGELKKLPKQLDGISTDVETLGTLQRVQNQALLAILRNDLYQCFKCNREIEAWTDDDCRVQTTLHEVYKGLNGNGEEDIWWERKKKWRIVSNEEYCDLLENHRCDTLRK